jgi:tRNA nucleotidyltransferase/poly(A) polymerase
MNSLLNSDLSKLQRSVENLIQRCHTVAALVELAQARKYELYLVGGFLRDSLLNRSCKDVDFVSCQASELARLVAKQTGSKAVLIDRKFGTLRFVSPAQANGIAKPVVVDLSPLRGSSILDDLHQRDFTLNALAFDMSAWWGHRETHLLDPLGGMADLAAGILRPCSVSSLSDDPLRILRAYRLVSAYGLIADAETRKSILQARHGLNQVAVERSRDELMLILAAANSVSILRMLDEDGILKLLLPKYVDMGTLEKNGSLYQDLWQHSLSALEALEFFLSNIGELFGTYGDEASVILAQNLAGNRSRQTALKLAVLLHDAGKPPGNNGSTLYGGHEIAGAKLAASLCSRLRLSNKEINFVSQLVRQQKRPVHLFYLTRPSRRALCRFFRLGPELFWPLLLFFASEYRARQKSTGVQGDLKSLPERVQGWLDFYYSELKPREMEPPILSGHDIMKYFDLSPGPTVGKLLKTLTELQWEGRLNSKKEALDQAAELLKRWKR